MTTDDLHGELPSWPRPELWELDNAAIEPPTGTTTPRNERLRRLLSIPGVTTADKL